MTAPLIALNSAIGGEIGDANAGCGTSIAIDSSCMVPFVREKLLLIRIREETTI